MRNFRGLTKDARQVYGYPFPVKDRVFMILDDADSHLESAYEDGQIEDFIEVIPETVAQQVGLKDKKGKDVYKIDVIKGIHKTTKEEITGEVVWDEGAFQWGIQLDSWIMNFECLVSCYEFEIIPPEEEKSK